VPAWRQAAPAGLAGAGAPGSWLLFLDPAGLGERIAERLRRDGHQVMTVAAGDGLDTREGYETLIRRLREEGLPTHILHLWGATAEEPSYDEAQQAGLLSLMFLEQALTNSEGPPIRIGVVTAGAHEVVDGDRVIPARATVLGACKVIHQESRQLTCVSIDVALPPAGSPGEERLIGQLLAEMDVPESGLEPVVAYRGRQRWVRTFEPVRIPEDGASLLRPDGAYVITDGTHAVGPSMAEALSAGGARVTVLSVDLTDPEALAGALQEAQGRFGRLDGVLHTAAPFTGGLIQLKAPEGLEAALRPVARGAEALFEALERTGIDPGFVLLTSSTLAFSGGLGQLDIAAAGCYLDALAQRRMAEAGPYTVVAHWDPYQWEGWLAAGTAALGVQTGQLEQELESYGTHPERSAEALRRLLATPLQRAVVTARDLRVLIAETDAFTIEAFMAEMQKAHSDQEARGRTGIATPYVEPAGDLERQVAAIWEELFGIRPIGSEDNFLELGGHSLLAIQMATQLRNAFGVDLPVTVLFEAPTVSALSAAIAREQGGGEDPDELERLLALVEGLSPEEALRKMEELGVSPEEVLQ
jgi:phthiocerol/phenolphthiocerol synthesis type-I polyketide synthase E